MFGIIDRNGEPSTDDARYIKAGFSREGIDRIIKINMHRQIDDAYQEPEPKDIMLQDCRKAINLYLNARDIKEFKKYVVSKFVQNITSIASNPVGRLLLYRLLIEIRRTQGGVGCLEGNNQDPNTLNYELLESNNKDLLERRNRMRAIIVNFMSAFGFDDDNGVFAFSLHLPELILINTTDNKLLAETCESDVAIVHEMVHWYQRLRHPRRVDVEAQLNIYEAGNFDSSPICEIMKYEKMLKIEGLWTKRGFPVDVCEFRVVFGLPEAPNENLNWCFLNGDELSENLYRISKSIQAKKETREVRFSYIQNSPDLMHIADDALNEITETNQVGAKNNSIIEYANKLNGILDIE